MSNTLVPPVDILRQATPEDWESIQPTWVISPVPTHSAMGFPPLLSATSTSGDGNNDSLLYFGEHADTNGSYRGTQPTPLCPSRGPSRTEETHEVVTRVETDNVAQEARGEYTCTFFFDLGHIPPSRRLRLVFGRRIFGRKAKNFRNMCPNTKFEFPWRAKSDSMGSALLLSFSSPDSAEYEVAKQQMFLQLENVLAKYNQQFSTQIRFTVKEH